MNRKYPNKQYKTKVGENILYWRRLKGLKQEHLAEKIGISTTALSNIENGVSKPDIERLEDIADALEIEIAQLLHNPQQMFVADNALQSSVVTNTYASVDKILIERLTTAMENITSFLTSDKK